MLKKPEIRLPIAFIIKGKQGTGKSLLLNVIGNLINEKYYISSSNVNDFFGPFAEGFVNKLLVNMNEVEGRDTVDYEGKMKSFITESKITINQKGIRPYQINNFARLIITTNKNNPIKIDVSSKDRRYVVFETTDHFLQSKYTSNFWIKLIDYFKKPSFIAALYDDLINIDIENYNYQNNRPITKSYKNMRKLYVPNESLFLEDWIENYMTTHPSKSNLLIDYNGLEFYNRFITYTSQYAPENATKSLKKFYIEMEALNFPIEITKPNNKTTFRFNPIVVYKYLLERGWREPTGNEIFEENLDNRNDVEIIESNEYNFNLI
jgi:phage/plasmid-associated DNA primase